MARPRRSSGWHQLDRPWAERLVADAGIRPGDLVVDVGAGFGVITAALLDVGARVIAVENHAGRIAHLQARFGRDVVVVAADGGDLRLPRRPFRVVANPPFAITAALLTRLVHPGSRLRSAHLVLQEQAARRWAGPSAPAARRWQSGFEPALGPRIPRTAFRPPPRVSTRVLVLRRR